MKKTVTIFGSSRPREGEPQYEEARRLGYLLAEAGFCVCNGGFAGIMEASARGAREAGGKTIGVTLNAFGGRANAYIDTEIRAGSLLARVEKLIELGDAYIVVKGGTGTLVELAIVWEYMNKGLMPVKPFFVLGQFWEPVVTTLAEELAWEGSESASRYITVARRPEDIVERLRKEWNHG